MIGGSFWKWIRHLGGPGLILLGLADNTPFVSAPAGSMDVVLALLSAANHELWGYYAFMATLGEVAGGYLTYRLAAKGGQEILEKRAGKSLAGRLYGQFEKHGLLVLFGGCILPPPFPFTSLLMTAGVMQYPQRRFLYVLAIGRSLRFFAVAFLGRTYGRAVAAFFSRHFQPMVYALLALVFTVGIGLLIYFGLRRRPTAGNQKT